MSLPKNVEEAAKQADELLRQMQENPEGEKIEETPAPEGSGEEQAPEVEKKEEVKEEKKETPPEPKAPEIDFKEYERLKAAHSVLQGKYNAEVPRLHEKVRELEALLAEAQKPAQPSSGGKPHNIEGSLKKIEEDYGEEFAKHLESSINERIEAAVGKVRSEVEGVKTTVAKTKQEKFLQELSGLVPEWQDIFNDPGFSEFLDGEDAYSGKSLRELAVEANNAMNAKRLAVFYKAYQDGRKTVEPEAKKDKREALITPAASGKQNTGTGGEKQDIIKASVMEKFYSDVARGAYQYRPKEREAMEERINNAIAKGWITEG